MIAALSNYDGVLCSRCNAPIPVSQKIVRLKGDANNENTTPGSFAARCRVCEYESVYPFSSIQSMEGQPQKRIAKTRRASA